MKIVINDKFGGFGLSPEATLELWRRGAPVEATLTEEYWPPETQYHSKEAEALLGYRGCLEKWQEYLAGRGDDPPFLTVFSPDEHHVLNAGDMPRNDPHLVELVEDWGEKAGGRFAKLKVVEIPDDVEWTIEEYDGKEWVAEKHRSWS